jgi:hypothetical protein
MLIHKDLIKKYFEMEWDKIPTFIEISVRKCKYCGVIGRLHKEGCPYNKK